MELYSFLFETATGLSLVAMEQQRLKQRQQEDDEFADGKNDDSSFNSSTYSISEEGEDDHMDDHEFIELARNAAHIFPVGYVLPSLPQQRQADHQVKEQADDEEEEEDDEEEEEEERKEMAKLLLRKRHLEEKLKTKSQQYKWNTIFKVIMKEIIWLPRSLLLWTKAYKMCYNINTLLFVTQINDGLN